eukprot:scaffold96114_cov28-Phaeocystis_antarctica.AAC.1
MQPSLQPHAAQAAPPMRPRLHPPCGPGCTPHAAQAATLYTQAATWTSHTPRLQPGHPIHPGGRARRRRADRGAGRPLP